MVYGLWLDYDAQPFLGVDDEDAEEDAPHEEVAHI
jgi:hypothetical protein